MHWYFQAFKHSTNFSGRTGRTAFWWFMLIHIMISAILIVLDIGIGHLGWLDWVYSLLLLLPSLSVTVRRLRDTGLSLWWSLVILIPLAGMVMFLVILALPSHRDSTRGVAL